MALIQTTLPRGETVGAGLPIPMTGMMAARHKAMIFQSLTPEPSLFGFVPMARRLS
jgi:hypothetical protein